MRHLPRRSLRTSCGRISLQSSASYSPACACQGPRCSSPGGGPTEEASQSKAWPPAMWKPPMAEELHQHVRPTMPRRTPPPTKPGSHQPRPSTPSAPATPQGQGRLLMRCPCASALGRRCCQPGLAQGAKPLPCACLTRPHTCPSRALAELLPLLGACCV